MTGIPEEMPGLRSWTRTDRESESSAVQDMSEIWIRVGSSLEPAPIKKITCRVSPVSVIR